MKHTSARWLIAGTLGVALALATLAAAAPAGKHRIATFNLAPRKTQATSRRVALSAFQNTVEVIETFLYGQKGKKAAAKEGRRLWLDEIRPSGPNGDGSVRLIVRYVTPRTTTQGGNR